MDVFDVGIIGGGVAGTSLAWALSRRGARVALFERDVIGAGASGRNAGSLVPPLSPHLRDLYKDTLRLLGELTDAEPSLCPPRQSGVLALTPDEDRAHAIAGALSSFDPSLAPGVLGVGEPTATERHIAPVHAAVHLPLAHTVEPLAVTEAFAHAARASGASIREHTSARPLTAGGRVVGVRTNDGDVACEAVVLCLGVAPDAALASGGQIAVVPVWGVVAEMRLEDPPRAILVEAEGLMPPATDQPQHDPASVADTEEIGFGLVTPNRTSSLGHSLGTRAPDVRTIVSSLLRYAATYLPDIARSAVVATRVCARPTSFDDMPIVGPVAGTDGCYTLGGLGSRGLTVGPGAAGVLSRAILDRAEIPAALDSRRFLEGETG